MATVIPTGDKNAFIAITAVRNPYEAMRLATVLVNYEDVATCIFRQIDDFTAFPQYLTQAMASFSNLTALNAVGVYYGQTIGSLLTDPVLFINTTTSNGVAFDTNTNSFALLGNSYVNNVKPGANITIRHLYIGPGSTVDFYDGSASGSFVNRIKLPYVNNLGAKLNGIKFGSLTGQIEVDQNSYFGGYINDDPKLTCALPVTNLAYGVVTHNTFELTWTPPTGYLFINIYYKLKDAFDWIQASASDGDYVSNTGFTFRYLLADTFYSFRVNVTCINGGISTDSTLDQQTNSSTVISSGGLGV